MRITYYGHSCFLLETGGKRILLDPFVTGNPLAKSVDVNAIKCDYIFPSHAHGDHIGDLETVAANNPGATIVAIAEVAGYYGAKGLKVHAMNKGGWFTFDFGRVKMVNAVHSSSFPDHTYGGEPVGFVFDTADGVLYFAGDTALTIDMRLIPMTCPPLTAAILPIGSNYTMDYHDALIASDFLHCPQIIGCHYDSFGNIVIDHNAAQHAFSERGKELVLMPIAGTLNI
jgi:L-ascorbate metabolism protein UlaG (beta-lactamase superfamily)